MSSPRRTSTTAASACRPSPAEDPARPAWSRDERELARRLRAATTTRRASTVDGRLRASSSDRRVLGHGTATRDASSDLIGEAVARRRAVRGRSADRLRAAPSRTTRRFAYLADVYVLPELPRARARRRARAPRAVERGPYAKRPLAAAHGRTRTRSTNASASARANEKLTRARPVAGPSHLVGCTAVNFQDMIAALQSYWAERGCVIMQPYHTELGAGTSNPATFLRVPRPEPEGVARRLRRAGRSARPTAATARTRSASSTTSSTRSILKPAPEDVLDQYFGSLEALGIDLRTHDIRLVEDDWEQPTLGAWGLGWEVWSDGDGGHAVHVLPAARRRSTWSSSRPRSRTGSSGSRMFAAGQGDRRSSWSGRRASPGATSIARTSGSGRMYNYEEAPVGRPAAALRRARGGVPPPARARACRCRRTTRCSSRRTPSTCSTRAARCRVTERAAYIGRVRKLAAPFAQLYSS